MAAFCGHGKMENFKLKSFDGTELYCYLFDKVENPKGVVMVVHGMGEHMGRYIHFAEYLNSRGYIVFGDDHRGHGFSETDVDRGHHDGDMFSDTVKDEVFFLKYLEDRYKLRLSARLPKRQGIRAATLRRFTPKISCRFSTQ